MDTATEHPIKASRLGWAMDHEWCLRAKRWDLAGEAWSAAGGHALVAGEVEVESGEGGGFRVRRSIAPSGSSSSATVDGGTEAISTACLAGSWIVGAAETVPGRSLRPQDGSWMGRIAVVGRQILARAVAPSEEGGSSWDETAEVQPDGSYRLSGRLARGPVVVAAWEFVATPAASEETWTIAPAIEGEIAAHARAGAPIEQCGLLIGIPGERRITRVAMLSNVDQSEDHFTVDPREHFKVVKSLRGTGEDVVGNWHSHPFSPARMSEEDLGLAVDDTALYAIVSLMDPAQPVLRAYRVCGGRVASVALRS